MQPQPTSDLKPQGFALNPDASYCEVGGTIIAMNRVSERYQLFTGPQVRWFNEIRAAASPDPISPEALRFAAALGTYGILMPAGAGSGPIAPFSYPPATASLFDLTAAHTPGLAPSAAIRFLQACLRARPLQGRWPVRRCVSAVRSWKQRLPSAPVFADTRLGAHVASFQTWSTLFITTHDACLPRSLVLLAYLALRGIPADLVFGVRLSPFMAHCWAQYGHTVLNDHLENTAAFAPVFAV